jgi:2,4-diaminopentanoate dehydrogenase
MRVLQFGLGPIGLLTARAVLERPHAVELVAAVDIDPGKIGRDVGDLLGLDRPTGVIVSGDASRALRESRPDAVLHTTSSFLARAADQIELCVEAGAHVVSSSEELAFPFHRHPEIAERLDRLARQRGVVVVGTGVNPGFAMDALALTATGTCTAVHSVRVERVVDAGRRRQPLQLKVGAGITEAEFAERRAGGTFGHIGLVESLRLIAAGLGWTLDRVEEVLEPVVSPREVRTPFLTVSAGSVAGIHHAARGFAASGDDRPAITLDLKMYVGAEDPRDAILIDGDPPIDLVVRGGIFGDTATAGALVNALGLVKIAPAGLRTVADLPLPRAFGTLPG